MRPAKDPAKPLSRSFNAEYPGFRKIKLGKTTGVVFEDDGIDAYFYATNGSHTRVYDAVHVYDRREEDALLPGEQYLVVHHPASRRAGLYYRGELRAVVDFAHRRSCSRTGYPPSYGENGWSLEGHGWNRALARGLAPGDDIIRDTTYAEWLDGMRREIDHLRSNGRILSLPSLREMDETEETLPLTGKLVWGAVAQMDDDLLVPGDTRLPITVMWSPDPLASQRVSLLLQQAGTLVRWRGTLYDARFQRIEFDAGPGEGESHEWGPPEEDFEADEQDFDTEPWDRDESIESAPVFPLPPDSPGSAPWLEAHYTRISVRPEDLPGRMLLEPAIPVLVSSECGSEAMVLPSRLWPRALCKRWDGVIAAWAEPDDIVENIGIERWMREGKLPKEERTLSPDGKHCPNCSADIGLWAVFKALTPDRIKCPSCSAGLRYELPRDGAEWVALVLGASLAAAALWFVLLPVPLEGYRWKTTFYVWMASFWLMRLAVAQFMRVGRRLQLFSLPGERRSTEVPLGKNEQ